MLFNDLKSYVRNTILLKFLKRFFYPGNDIVWLISLAPGVSQPGFPQTTYTAPQSSNQNASLYPVGNYGPQYATGQIQNQQQSYSTPYQPPPQQYPPPSEFPEKQASAPPPPSYDEVTHWLCYHQSLLSRNFKHCFLWILMLCCDFYDTTYDITLIINTKYSM